MRRVLSEWFGDLEDLDDSARSHRPASRAQPRYCPLTCQHSGRKEERAPATRQRNDGLLAPPTTHRLVNTTARAITAWRDKTTARRLQQAPPLVGPANDGGGQRISSCQEQTVFQLMMPTLRTRQHRARPPMVGRG